MKYAYCCQACVRSIDKYASHAAPTTPQQLQKPSNVILLAFGGTRMHASSIEPVDPGLEQPNGYTSRCICTQPNRAAMFRAHCQSVLQHTRATIRGWSLRLDNCKEFQSSGRLGVPVGSREPAQHQVFALGNQNRNPIDNTAKKRMRMRSKWSSSSTRLSIDLHHEAG